MFRLLPRRPRWQAAMPTLAIAMPLIAGCITSQSPPIEKLKQYLSASKVEPLPPSGPTKVVTDSSALALELPDSDVQARSAFGQSFTRLAQEGRTAAARLQVARHLDHTYELLVRPDQGQDTEVRRLMAALYDRTCDTKSGWALVVQAEHEPNVAEYLARRSRWMAGVAAGEFKETARLDLVAAAQASNYRPLLVDAWYQTGVGAMLRGDNAKAAVALEKCAELAGAHCGMLGPQARLLGSEARRRNGDFDGANAAWQQSARTAAQLLAERGVSDPGYWERVLYLQPVGVGLPGDVAENFRRFAESPWTPLQADLMRQLATCDTSSTPITSECWVETAIAAWQDQRGESQKAILRLKKAETLASGGAVDWLRIAQAQQLARLGQPGMHTALLAQLTAKEIDSPAKFAALAELGVTRVQSGALPQGLQLLKQALDEQPSVHWPGRASAEADHALGLLMLGDTENGLAKLETAQRQFEAEGNVEQLARSMWNQAKFLEHMESDKGEIEAVEQRLAALKL